MNKVQQLKQALTPTTVVSHYLGQPQKICGTNLIYKSPFRNERTASFWVSDAKGIHDFGTSIHYDIISFTQELFKINFKMAIDKLAVDFGIMTENSISKELEVYLINKRAEEIELNKKINSWFYKIYGILCDTLKTNKKIEHHLKGEALSIIYKKNSSLEILIEIFFNATENEKYELYKNRDEIYKILN